MALIVYMPVKENCSLLFSSGHLSSKRLLCWKIVDFLPVISKIVDCMLVILPVIFKIVDSRLFTNTNTSHPNDYSRQLQKLQHLLKV